MRPNSCLSRASPGFRPLRKESFPARPAEPDAGHPALSSRPNYTTTPQPGKQPAAGPVATRWQTGALRVWDVVALLPNPARVSPNPA